MDVCESLLPCDELVNEAAAAGLTGGGERLLAGQPGRGGRHRDKHRLDRPGHLQPVVCKEVRLSWVTLGSTAEGD